MLEMATNSLSSASSINSSGGAASISISFLSSSVQRDASLPDWVAPVPDLCRQLAVQHMGWRERAAWRLTSRQACREVWEATRSLTALQSGDMQLPVSLHTLCPGLLRVSCGAALLHSLHGLPGGLRELEVNCCSKIQDFKPLLQCTVLRELTLSDSCHPWVRDVDQGLVAVLPMLTTLRALSVGDWRQPQAALALAPAIGALVHLRRLQYSGDGRRPYSGQWELMAPAGAAALGDALVRLPGLTSLDLTRRCVNDEGAQLLSPTIRALTRLRELRLAYHNLADGGAACLAAAFTSLGQLTLLGLRSYNPCSLIAALLGPSLRQLPGLKALHFFCNDVCFEGAREWAGGLSTLTALTYLSFNDTALKSEGMGAFAPAVRALTALRELHLEYSRLGPEGAAVLATCLPPLRQLVTLNLSGNWVEAKGAAVLTPALRTLPCLRRLDLRWNRIGAETLHEMLWALPPLHGRLWKSQATAGPLL